MTCARRTSLSWNSRGTSARCGLPVPEIYESELDAGAYLEEDLGDVTLFQFLSRNRVGDDVAPEAVEAYRKVVAQLPRFQIEGFARPELQSLLSALQL